MRSSRGVLRRLHLSRLGKSAPAAVNSEEPTDRAVAELMALASRLELPDSALDEAVYDSEAPSASSLNNQGIEAHLRWLLSVNDSGTVRRLVQDAARSISTGSSGWQPWSVLRRVRERFPRAKRRSREIDVPVAPRIRTFLDVSTAHVSDEVINQPGGLNAIEGVIAYQDEYGAWLWVPDDVDQRLEEYDYTSTATGQPGMDAESDHDGAGRTIRDVEALWRYARQLGCDYIRLDANADVDPRLPTYEW